MWWNALIKGSLKVKLPCYGFLECGGMIAWKSESLDVWKFECLKVWAFGSLDVWISECLKVWMSQCLDVWKSGCLSLNFWKSGCLKEVSHESFFLKAGTSGIWRKSRSLARNLSFQSLNTWNLKEVSHESFVFKAWTLGIWRKSRTKRVLARSRMHEILYFARQNVSRMMCGEACPPDGSQTVSAMFGSWLDRPRSGSASSSIGWVTFARVVLSCYAIQSLQIAATVELIVHESLCRRSCA